MTRLASEAPAPAHHYVRRLKILRIAAALAAATLFLPGAASARSDVCPESTIKLIVPFPAGGPVDTSARIVQDQLREHLGKTVVIDNRSGASGSIGTAYAAQQPGDGCTILFAYDTHGVNPWLIRDIPFDTITAFKPVMLIGTIPNVLVAHPSTPWKTFNELVADARTKPGQFAYATGGNGSLAHLMTKLLEQLYAIELQHVAYRGGGPAFQDVVGGHVPMMMGSIVSLGSAVRDNRLRALAQTGAKRHPLLPDVPTIAELGHPDFNVVSWIGAFLPASASDAAVQRLHGALAKALQNSTVRERMAGIGVVLVGSSPQELGDFTKAEVKRWGEVIAKYKIQQD